MGAMTPSRAWPLSLLSSRRGFLRLAGASAGLTALAGLRVAPGAARAAEPPDAPRFFDDDETAILTAVLERVVDSGHPDAPRVADTRAVAGVEALCRGLAPELQRQVRWLLQGMEYGPIVFDLTFTRFTRMSAEERDASLRAWSTSRFGLRRLAFTAMRNLCFLAWYSQEETWPLIGYAGPLVGRPKRRADA
jgi:hypothetical protein